MPELLLALVLMFQSNPGQAGIVKGQVLTPMGTPASGVRVFAIPATTPDLVYESLVQTDASGKYQLPVPPGRYNIAAGAVTSPTYYPKAIVVSANTTVENIDFPQYVPVAVGAGPGLSRLQLAGSTGVLAGMIRLPDGAPAGRVPVMLAPSSVVNSAAAGNAVRAPALVMDQGNYASAVAAGRIPAQGGAIWLRTDSSGHYRFEGIPPDTYIVMAGHADNPASYPATISTTFATNVRNLDISLLPSQGTTTTVQGKIVTLPSRPATGAWVALVAEGKATGAAALLPAKENPRVRTDGNGTYRFDNVAPGTYELQTELNGSWFSSKAMSVVVSDQPVTANFEFDTRMVSGKIVWDDGAPFRDGAVSQISISTTGNPNSIDTRMAAVSGNGSFSMVVEAGAYRVFVTDLPAQYTVTSASALSFSGDAPGDVVIRIAKKTGSSPRFTGRAVDGSGKPVVANRIVLCCMRSGPVGQISTALQSDGTFEFTELPAGRYIVELWNQSRLVSSGPNIEVGTSDLSDLNIVSTRGTGSVRAAIK